MADDERLRLRSHLAELLSPAQVTQAARGTDTVHDVPVVGGGVKGDAGQEYSTLVRFCAPNQFAPGGTWA